jgi:iron complex outermembrane receptor protein
VNVAAYYYDYRNLQVTQFVSGLYILNNAAKAEIKGVDFDITARPIADLQLAVSGTLLDPTYKDYRNGQGYVPVPITSVNPSGGMGGFIQTPTDLSGNQVIFTSKQTVNLSGAYTWRTSFGDIDASVVAQYRSRVYFDPQNGATQPSYTMVSGAVTWTSPERDWEVRVWGSNLTDEQIYATIARSTTGDLATPIAPRTFGVSVQKSF